VSKAGKVCLSDFGESIAVSKNYTWIIVAGLVLGLIVGGVLHETVTDEAMRKTLTDYFKVATDVFLRMIKMIIAPLVFSTLVVGIAHMGTGGNVGRTGLRTILWFLGASMVSLVLGILMVNLLEPGVNSTLSLPTGGNTTGIEGSALNLKDFITNLIPKSIFEAMATNQILQIVIFSVFFGIACASVGDKAKKIVSGIEELVQIMLTVTGYVMKFAPIAVFAAVASVVTNKGLGVIVDYLEFIAGFYLALVLLWILLIGAGALVIGKRVISLISHVREPILLAFSTASSEAAYPKTLEQLEKFGISRRIASFVLPLGYSFNLDGSMMYCAFATIFIAQIAGVDLTLTQEISMLLLLMVTSKGMAAVPRASLVVIAATLSQFNLPIEGLVLIFAVDQFLDMGRTATNVVGNSIATAVVAKWEGELKPAPTSTV
jgi:Na+/H+-dicarboxylate symporter